MDLFDLGIGLDPNVGFVLDLLDEVYGLAAPACLPCGSVLNAEAKCYADWGRSARNAALCGRRREHGDARRAGPVKVFLSEATPGYAIAAYETEMFSRMRSMTADTMVNTEMFYAPDACERVEALFRSFIEGEALPRVDEA